MAQHGHSYYNGYNETVRISSPIAYKEEYGYGIDLQPWILSIIGSIIVGLSGIFPLLVIPLDETATLKTGTGAKTLRVLLSFAVGGLLGDVFLHLLPEAWENQRWHKHSDMSKMDQPSLSCGLWVLAGLLVFIIIEKVFSFDKESEVDRDDFPLSSTIAEQLPVRRKKSSFILNDLEYNTGNTIHPIAILKNKASNIRVSGYLNLIANLIDNFTHGLAVGGSFLMSTRIGILTTFAILALSRKNPAVHEIPHEVGDFAILLRSGFSRYDAACAQVYTASAGILGAATALILSAVSVEARTNWILPFTAGGFLHIALVTVLPELLEEDNPKESLKQFCSLATGITIMAVMTFIVDG